MSKKTSIGGQALIEGIMMKGPRKTAMAVRKKDGEIDLSYMNQKSAKDRFAPFGWPVIRGVAGFIEAMITGYKALMLSADKSGFTEIEEEDGKKSRLSDRIMNVVMIVGAVLGVALAVVLFMAVPRLAVGGLQRLFGEFSPVVRSGIEQLMKLSVFVIYVFAVSRMKDIRRVFMYHGAEHKTIFCYENGLPLTVENIRPMSRFHPRCGTSFMILMILVSIVVSTIAQMIFPGVYEVMWLWVTVKILLVPVCCGVGYELLKFCGRHDNIITKTIAAPGLWLQRITTVEPEDDMLEVAAAALSAVLPEEGEDDRW